MLHCTPPPSLPLAPSIQTKIVDFLQSVYGFDVANDVDLFPFDFVDVLQTCCLLARQMYKKRKKRVSLSVSATLEIWAWYERILLYLFRKIFVIWIHFGACCICIMLMKMRKPHSSIPLPLPPSVYVYMLTHIERDGQTENPVQRADACLVFGGVFSLANIFDSFSSCWKAYTKYILYTKTLAYTLYSFDYQCGNWGIPFSLFMPWMCVSCISLYCSPFSSSCHAQTNHSHYPSDSTAIVCSIFCADETQWNRLKSSFHIFWWFQNTDKWYGLHEQIRAWDNI